MFYLERNVGRGRRVCKYVIHVEVFIKSNTSCKELFLNIKLFNFAFEGKLIDMQYLVICREFSLYYKNILYICLRTWKFLLSWETIVFVTMTLRERWKQIFVSANVHLQ